MPPAGRLGDKAKIPVDIHGCPACPHPAIGPAIVGSPTVKVNGKPALRLGDKGIHAACCATNMWEAMTGSGTVMINGMPAHRMNDITRHCGGMGKLIEGSGNVETGGPPSGGGGSFEWAGGGFDKMGGSLSGDGLSFGPTLEGYLFRGQTKIPLVNVDAMGSGPSVSGSAGFSKGRYGASASASVLSGELSKGPVSVGAKVLAADADIGYSKGSVGASAGVNLASAKAKVGPATAEIGLKAELGLSIGKKTKVKLGPVSFGIDF
jgi:uncharacterized Zn-binding protein involved in type VI secretion